MHRSWGVSRSAYHLPAGPVAEVGELDRTDFPVIPTGSEPARPELGRGISGEAWAWPLPLGLMSPTHGPGQLGACPTPPSREKKDMHLMSWGQLGQS